MSTYEALRGLPLAIERYALETLKKSVSSGFERVTTVVRLAGGGHEGLGEDVTYDAGDQASFAERGAVLPLAGRYTLDSFSELVASLDTFGDPPAHEESRLYRRWALESAALDLALRQSGKSLAAALGREPRPVRFVVSTRLGEPPATDGLDALARRYPWIRFKLDATSDWTDELVSELAASSRVAVIDLKGGYEGTPVDQPADPQLYRRIVSAFDHVWLEDPELTPKTREILASAMDRVTWDAPLHSVRDIVERSPVPRMVNVKPSRFGSVSELCDVYDHCARAGIGMYGGGQFELGPGRGQIQLLASLFHHESPNDVAPRGFNEPVPPAGLPKSPLDVRPARAGFITAPHRPEVGTG